MNQIKALSLVCLLQGVVLFGDEESGQEGSISNEELSLSAAGQSEQEENSFSKNSNCSSPCRRASVELRHKEARGVGYKKGYTTLELFAILDSNPSFMPFLDIRGHVFNDGKLAGNVGLGERTLFRSGKYVFGSYLYYDLRQDHHHLLVKQLSPGFELMGERVEFRTNGYFPLGNKRSEQYHPTFHRFQNHSILVKIKEKKAMTGFDSELGFHCTHNTSHDVYAGVGPYYFTNSKASAWGGQGRIYYRYRDLLSFTASGFVDHLFHGVVQGEIGVKVPFGEKIRSKRRTCSKRRQIILSRASFAPSRMEIPVVKTIKLKKKGKNPFSGKPWFVWFVDNTSSSLGTFESPFPTLAQAQNASSDFDMIYVFPGDGTSTGMTSGIVLKNQQHLLGAGMAQSVRTSKGKIVIPAMADSFPLITNTTGDVILLADGNRVVGLNLFVTQASSSGIFGGFVDGLGMMRSFINGATIKNNNISGSVAHDGIFIQGSGTVKIDSNQLSSSFLTRDGILIQVQDGTTLNETISNNFVSGYGFSIQSIPFSTPSAGRETLTIVRNLCQGFGARGITHFQGPDNTNVLIQENLVLNTAGATSSEGILSFVAQNNNRVVINRNVVISTTGAVAASIVDQTSATSPITINTQITNNIVIVGPAVGSVGISVSAGANAVMCASISDNLITSQTAGNVGLALSGTGVLNIQNFSGNITPTVFSSGNVNLVTSCDP